MAVAEVAGNEETGVILRARSRQDEVKITVLVQVGHLDVIALRVDHYILTDSEITGPSPRRICKWVPPAKPFS